MSRLDTFNRKLADGVIDYEKMLALYELTDDTIRQPQTDEEIEMLELMELNYQCDQAAELINSPDPLESDYGRHYYNEYAQDMMERFKVDVDLLWDVDVRKALEETRQLRASMTDLDQEPSQTV